MSGRWLTPPVVGGSSASRLICFAHAGGGTGLFRTWRTTFCDRFDVRSAMLPGRESRLRDKPIDNLEALLDPLVETVTELDRRPLALFGHSMGAVVAFELARRLTQLDRPPDLLLVSGRRAPHLRARRPPAYDLDDDGFLEAVRALNGTPDEVLQDESLMSLLLPSLRADFKLIETYSPLPGPMLRIPVVGYRGLSDPEVNHQELLAWNEVTSDKFDFVEFNGDHFYLQPPPPVLLNDIACRLETHVQQG